MPIGEKDMKEEQTDVEQKTTNLFCDTETSRKDTGTRCPQGLEPRTSVDRRDWAALVEVAGEAQSSGDRRGAAQRGRGAELRS